MVDSTSSSSKSVICDRILFFIAGNVLSLQFCCGVLFWERTRSGGQWLTSPRLSPSSEESHHQELSSSAISATNHSQTVRSTPNSHWISSEDFSQSTHAIAMNATAVVTPEFGHAHVRPAILLKQNAVLVCLA